MHRSYTYSKTVASVPYIHHALTGLHNTPCTHAPAGYMYCEGEVHELIYASVCVEHVVTLYMSYEPFTSFPSYKQMVSADKACESSSSQVSCQLHESSVVRQAHLDGCVRLWASSLGCDIAPRMRAALLGERAMRALRVTLATTHAMQAMHARAMPSAS